VSDGGDLAILGARIRTLDPDRPWATAVAIRDGVIVAVGDDDEVRTASGPGAELIDRSWARLRRAGPIWPAPPRWTRCASGWRPSGVTVARVSG
jgi:hypothetical protein